jgi:hypothetical protein
MRLRLRAVEKSLRTNFTRCAGKRAQAYFERLIVGKISPEVVGIAPAQILLY